MPHQEVWCRRRQIRDDSGDFLRLAEAGERLDARAFLPGIGSYFSDKSGEYKLYIEAQDGLTPAREIALPNTKHYYTPAWSPDSKKILYTDTDLKLWVLDVASGQAKRVGEDPWMVPTRTMNPVWSPDSKWIAYVKHLNSLYKAIVAYNVETGVTKQVTDGLSDVISPAWDASGKYLWFFASTDFGLKSQWLDMSNYDHDETFALYVTVLKKGEPTPFAPESDDENGAPAAPAGPGGGRGPVRGVGSAPGRGLRGGLSAVAVGDGFDAEASFSQIHPLKVSDGLFVFNDQNQAMDVVCAHGRSLSPKRQGSGNGL